MFGGMEGMRSDDGCQGRRYFSILECARAVKSHLFPIEAEPPDLHHGRRRHQRPTNHMDGGTAVNPAWSPDEQRIAFACKNLARRISISTHDLATGKNDQMTQSAGDNERPTWSPDGRHLAFESTRNGTSQIYSILADGTKVRQLTQSGKNQGPAWSGYLGQ